MDASSNFEGNVRLVPALRDCAGHSVTRPEADVVDRFCLFGLVGLLAFAPLPFGSARPWAAAVAALWVGGLVVVQSFGAPFGSARAHAADRRLTVPAVLYGTALLWCIVQTLPWTPLAWHHPLWSDAAAMLNFAGSGSISVVPVLSWSSITHLLTYAGAFWLSYRSAQSVRRTRFLTTAVVLVGAAYATWGLAAYWSGNDTIVWFRKWAYVWDLTGTFVNRNSAATYFGLSLLAAVALILVALERRVDFRDGRRAVLKSLIETVSGSDCIFFVSAALLGTSLLLTHSRGGFVATMIGTAALLLCAGAAPGVRAPIRGLMVLVVLIGGTGIVFLSGEATLHRLSDIALSADQRAEIYRSALDALAVNPLLGSGLHSFESVFAAYRTELLPETVERAHNDYLENAVEMGVPAAMFLLMALAAVLWIALRGVIRRRQDAVYPCLATSATALVALHSTVDFSLQIPAVSLTYAVLLGIGVAQAATTAEREG